ncbi:UNVERIFIED_CONTAM: putative aldouronate transport system substrate-binding protein [Acetivibrio alkalicellulosi]
MSKVKKSTCIALVVIMILGFVLTGCNQSNKEVVLECYFLAPQCRDINLVEEELNKILKEKIGATVKLNYFFWDNYQDQQRLAIASGKQIDLMFSPSWWGYSNYVSQQAFLPLDDLLDKYGKDIVSNIHPAYLEAPRIDGKLYAIPTAKDMTGVGGVLINKALVDKYNFDLSTIRSPEDFEPMLKVIKENEPGVVPFLSTQGDHSSYFLQDFYENIIRAEIPIGVKKTATGEPKVYNMQETPEFTRIANLTRDWYKKGYINSDVATLNNGMPIKRAQKAFMWGEQLKPGKAEEMKAQLGYEVVQVNAYADLTPFASTGDLTNSMLVIPRTSKHPEKAMAFLNLMFHDKEVKNLLSWGIEGVHYKKIGENQIDFADGVDANNSGYTGIAQWAMGGNQFLDYLWVSESSDKWEKMNAFNQSATISKTLGWIFNTEPVKAEVAALATVGIEFGRPIGSGIVDYDEHYPKMKSAMEAAGVDKVIEEAQRQLDEFLAQNR